MHLLILGLTVGLWIEHVKRLKELELENNRLRKAISDLTPDKLTLQEAARGNCQAPCVVTIDDERIRSDVERTRCSSFTWLAPSRCPGWV